MISRVCSLIKMMVPERNRGLLWASKSRVPSNVTDADGYQTGCIWLNTAGAAGTCVWTNEGSVTAASWVAADTSAGDAAGTVQFDDATTGPLISIETADQEGDAYLNPFLITGTYASECKKGIMLSASNPRPVTFLFDNHSVALGAADYRAVLSRVYICSDQANIITLNALRGQIKLADLVDVTSADAMVNSVRGYLELAGTGARTVNGHMAGVTAFLEEGASGTTTIGDVLCGFEAQLNSTRTYAGAGKLAAYYAGIHGAGTSKWQYGLYVPGGAVSAGICLGVQDTGIGLTTAFPFAVEVQCEANADIVAGDTGSTAGVYARYAVETAQTSNTAHIGMFGKLRVKADLGEGNHAGVMGWVEISGTTELGGSATTTTAAGNFAVIAESGLDLSTGHLNGVVVDCSVDDAATITGSLTGVRLKSSAGCYGWATGILVDLGTNVDAALELSSTGVSIILPQSTNDAASPALLGLSIAASGAMTATTSGDPTFTGISITTPACTCTLDSIVSTGLSITTGTITETGGTMTSTAVLLTGGTITSGTSLGINLAGTWTTAITLAEATNLFAFPADGTAPVAAGNYEVHGGTIVRISVTVGGSQYYMLASTAPTTQS